MELAEFYYLACCCKYSVLVILPLGRPKELMFMDIYNADGTRIGSVMSYSGNVYNAYGSGVGSVMSSGNIYNADGTRVGNCGSGLETLLVGGAALLLPKFGPN
jgi:diaminopimelate epimerase